MFNFTFFFCIRIGFCINTLGELQLTVNSQVVGCLLSDLPIETPLWIIIDVYGSTQSVQFVEEGMYETVSVMPCNYVLMSLRI